MTTYAAFVQRADRAWHIELPGVPGAFAQARRLTDVEHAARDAIARQLDVRADSFAVDVQIIDPVDGLAEQVRQAREQAERAQSAADALMRGAAHRYAEQGLTTRDIAALLGVSQQWVSILIRQEVAAA